MENLLEDEAVVVGGSNHSHATQDLYDAIAAGDYPEWKLLIQVRRCRHALSCSAASPVDHMVAHACCTELLQSAMQSSGYLSVAC